ncbi:MAG: 2Fe-2S iron-sulfur cluster binding domain-containing protein [Streptosporangiales bacterium]|nr:2Fe-2S iron-sulfur cluster binding domain-containing protein [Streptosporangiales bacterium]
MSDVRVALRVNGRAVEATVPARLGLADFLRDRLGLTGTHLGCEHGVCGACTVLLDGIAVRACLMFAAQAEGGDLWTIEGLHADGRIADLQEAMARHHGLQCGFCTPGFLVTAAELLAEGGRPSEQEVREALSGNVCRCTGYQGIVSAVLETARHRADRGDGPRDGEGAGRSLPAG